MNPTKFIHQLMRDNITETKFKILETCKSLPKNIKQISQELKIGYQAVYRHLEDLEKKGYVLISKPTKKNRGNPRLVSLTPKLNYILNQIQNGV